MSSCSLIAVLLQSRIATLEVTPKHTVQLFRTVLVRLTSTFGLIAWSAGNLLFSEEPLALANVIEITPCPPELDDVCSVTRDLLSSGTHRSLTGKRAVFVNCCSRRERVLTELDESAGNSIFACNRVEATVLQATVTPN